jgi:hypothetical protein
MKPKSSRRTPKFFMCAMSMPVNKGLMFVAKLTAIGRSLSLGSVAGGLAAVDLGEERGPHPFGNF